MSFFSFVSLAAIVVFIVLWWMWRPEDHRCRLPPDSEILATIRASFWERCRGWLGLGFSGLALASAVGAVLKAPGGALESVLAALPFLLLSVVGARRRLDGISDPDWLITNTGIRRPTIRGNRFHAWQDILSISAVVDRVYFSFRDGNRKRTKEFEFPRFRASAPTLALIGRLFVESRRAELSDVPEPQGLPIYMVPGR